MGTETAGIAGTLCAAGITLIEALGISGIALAVVGRENVAGTLKEL